MKKLLRDKRSIGAFCRAVRGSPFLALDTEFQRERRYYAQFCVLQIAAFDDEGELRVCAIDALSKRVSWDDIAELIFDESIVKVFHAARQDLEIFQRRFSRLPTSIFDTQIAAGLLGFGAMLGYDRLVRHFLGVEIDKGAQFVDWSARPLPTRHLSYAVGDVLYLAGMYPMLRDRLRERGRTEWMEDIQRSHLGRGAYLLSPEEVWRKHHPKGRGGGGGVRGEAALRRLWIWREEEAQRADRPRGSICSDHALNELALARPKNLEDMGRLRSRGKWAKGGEISKGILETIEQSLGDEVVRPTKRRPLNSEEQIRAGLLRSVLHLCAQGSGVAEEFLASRADLEEMVRRGEEAGVKAIEGWRREIFGEMALKFLEGRVALCIEHGEPSLVLHVGKKKRSKRTGREESILERRVELLRKLEGKNNP